MLWMWCFSLFCGVGMRERASNGISSWQGHFAASEVDYCQMCFVIQKSALAPSVTFHSSSWQPFLLVLPILFSVLLWILPVHLFTAAHQSFHFIAGMRKSVIFSIGNDIYIHTEMSNPFLTQQESNQFLDGLETRKEAASKATNMKALLSPNTDTMWRRRSKFPLQ